MAVKIMISSSLIPHIGKKDILFLDGSTVSEVLSRLTVQYSQVRKHLYGEDRNLRKFVSVYVENDDLRFLRGEKANVSEKDIINIVPSITEG